MAEPIPYSGFVGGTYVGDTERVAGQEVMNFYPEIVQAQGTKPPYPLVYRGTPGTKVYATAGTGPVRDIYEQNGRSFCISGTGMYEINADGTTTLLGAVATNQIPAKLAGNGTGGNQIMAVTGGLGYIYNTSTNVFAQITDSDFPANAQTCDFSDGYFLVLALNTRTVYFSASFNGLSWDGGDLFQKSQSADNIKTVVVNQKLVWLIGNDKTEVWRNTGDSLVPFAPIQGVLIEHGMDSFGSAVKTNDAIAWMGGDKDGKCQAWLVDTPFRPIRFSTHGLERVWNSYGRTDDAYSWSYQDNGHSFYNTTFPTPKKTWTYDFSSGLWHQRGYLNPATGDQDAHVGRCHAFAHDRHLVGSRIDGSIYDMSEDNLYDLDTKPVRRVIRAPHITANGREITINRLSLRCNTGVANATGQGSDPQIAMKYSIDGGMTFSEELFGGSGKVGKYESEVGWNCLGQGGDWVIEMATSEPLKHMWAAAMIDAEGDA